MDGCDLVPMFPFGDPDPVNCSTEAEIEEVQPGEPPDFACQWSSCRVRFGTFQAFVDHVHSHVAQEKVCGPPYPICQWKHCPRNAERPFKLRAQLLDHIRTHTRERPYVCRQEGCTHRFQRREHRLVHEKQHFSPTPFQCYVPGCNESFPNLVARRTHVKRFHRSWTLQEKNGKSFSKPLSLPPATNHIPSRSLNPSIHKSNLKQESRFEPGHVISPVLSSMHHRITQCTPHFDLSALQAGVSFGTNALMSTLCKLAAAEKDLYPLNNSASSNLVSPVPTKLPAAVLTPGHPCLTRTPVATGSAQVISESDLVLPDYMGSVTPAEEPILHLELPDDSPVKSDSDVILLAYESDAQIAKTVADCIEQHQPIAGPMPYPYRKSYDQFKVLADAMATYGPYIEQKYQELADSTGLSHSQVRWWFQNKRQLLKRHGKFPWPHAKPPVGLDKERVNSEFVEMAKLNPAYVGLNVTY